MDNLWVSRFLLIFCTFVLVGVYKLNWEKKNVRLMRIILLIFEMYAIVNIFILIYLWINHNTIYRVNLLEGSFFEHIRRAASGQEIYTKPSADFIAFAYQPLYYYLVVPFTKVLGLNVITARLVSILGTIGSMIVIFLAVFRKTNSSWWGILTCGLFASAYAVLDNNLELPHPDAWLLFSLLLGCFLIDQKQSNFKNGLGVLSLIISFWFKQHGAIFLIGALIYLSWRRNWRQTWFYWFMALILVPGLYIFIPNSLFGPYYHYFTWEVPRHWTELTFTAVRRLIIFVVKNYPFLSVLGMGMSAWYISRLRFKDNVWYFMMPFAVASAFLGTLDPGSSNNVFIPMGVWFMLTGTMGLKELLARFAVLERWGVHLAVLGATFSVFFFNPTTYVLSSSAETIYQDFAQYLDSLDGPVFVPWIGQLPDTDNLYPSVNWVALEDIVRGPGVDEQNHPVVKEILAPLIVPKGTSYLLTNFPLENDLMLSYLKDYYVLDEDLGNRFMLLQPYNPARFNLSWPRYLYKFSPHQGLKN